MLMSMARLTRRFQILLDDSRFEILERESVRTGKPVAELIRDSVDRVYGKDPAGRRAALDELLAERPMPVQDWPSMKSDMLASLHAEE